MRINDENVRDIDLIYSGTQRPSTEVSIVFHPGFNKPEGGLWTSPMGEDGKSVWQEWCEDNDYNTQYYQERWHIVPHEDCKILIVEEDLGNVKDYLVQDDEGYKVLDFEKISSSYDAVYFPDETVFLHNYRMDCLHAYDVESCLFLKPKFDVMDDEEYEKYKIKRNEELYQKREKEREEFLKRRYYEMMHPGLMIRRMEYEEREKKARELREQRAKEEENKSKEKVENPKIEIAKEETREKKEAEVKTVKEKIEPISKTSKKDVELSEKEKRKRAMLRRIAKLNISKEKGKVNPKRSRLEKTYLVMIDKLKNR